MKRLYKYFFGILGISFALTACDDWLDTEIKDPANLTISNKDEAYYARLREYKKSDHPVAFGWYGNWTGTGASYENSLKGLPDSVDFVSLWGNWKNPSPAMMEDLRYVQEKKGTKVLFCFLVLDIGDQITPPMPQEEINNGTSIEDISSGGGTIHWRIGWLQWRNMRTPCVIRSKSIIMMGSILMLNRMYSIRFLPIRNFGKITVK